MEGLSEAIEIPMDYAEEEMVIADTTLCSLVEHVGRTMADQPALLRYEEYALSSGPMFESLDMFAKYIFEYLYGIYAMNSKLGILHGDLHLNNITIFMKRNIVDIPTKKPYVPNPHIIYDLDNILYIFQHYGKTSCIIDFSRSILGAESPLLKDFHNMDEILADQRRKLLRTYERDLPEFYQEHKHELQAALLENYELVFRMATALDVYRLSSGILVLLGSMIKGAKNSVIKDELIPFLSKIQKMALNYLTLIMSKVLKHQTTKLEEIGWPVLEIITKNFDKWTAKNFKPPSELTVVDYFSTANKIQYDIRNYENFPPTVKFDYIIKHKIPTEQIGLQNYREYESYVKEQDEESRVEAIQKAEQESKAERRGSPVLALETGKKPDKEEIQEFKKEANAISSFYYDT
jgi:hypothetical protein